MAHVCILDTTVHGAIESLTAQAEERVTQTMTAIHSRQTRNVKVQGGERPVLAQVLQTQLIKFEEFVLPFLLLNILIYYIS